MTRGTWSAVQLGPDMRPSSGTVLASSADRADVEHLWQPGRVALCWSYASKPPRRLPQQTVARLRRRRLRRRLERTAPLFADELFEAELAARPRYYAGHRDQLD